MTFNLAFRRTVCALLIVGLVPATILPAFAFTGGVTTYNKPNATTVQRVNKSTAIAGAERDATYQRTMRTAQTAAAASKALRGLVRGVALIGTFATLFDFAKDLSGIWVAKPDGQNALIIPDKSFCTVAPCYEYLVESQPWFKTGPAAAAYFIQQRNISGAYFKDVYTLISADNTKLTFSWTRDGQVLYSALDQGYSTRLVPPSAGEQPTLQVSDQELEDYLAKSPRLPEILDEVDKKGSPIDFPEPEVEDMPQPIPLAPRVTTNPDGSKVINQTTLEPFVGPDGKTINWRKNEKTTEISAPDASGNTTSKVTNTNTDTGQSKVDKAPESPATDTALPAQPKLYTKKYPDGMTGVWRDQRSAMANSPLFTLPRMLMPSSVGSGGSCPVMNVNLTFSQWANFGTKDVAPPCYVWDWGKAICIVSACLLARRLIFGG